MQPPNPAPTRTIHQATRPPKTANGSHHCVRVWSIHKCPGWILLHRGSVRTHMLHASSRKVGKCTQNHRRDSQSFVDMSHWQRGVCKTIRTLFVWKVCAHDACLWLPAGIVLPLLEDRLFQPVHLQEIEINAVLPKCF